MPSKYRALLTAATDAALNGMFAFAGITITLGGTGVEWTQTLRPAVVLGGWRFLVVLDEQSDIVSMPKWLKERDPTGNGRRMLHRMGKFIKLTPKV